MSTVFCTRGAIAGHRTLARESLWILAMCFRSKKPQQVEGMANIMLCTILMCSCAVAAENATPGLPRPMRSSSDRSPIGTASSAASRSNRLELHRSQHVLSTISSKHTHHMVATSERPTSKEELHRLSRKTSQLVRHDTDHASASEDVVVLRRAGSMDKRK